MLKFYTLRVDHNHSLSRSTLGRYFIVTDGRYMAAYNEERYESGLFGNGAHRLDVGDNPSPTELAAAIKAMSSYLLASLIADYVPLHQAVTEADAIAETLDGEPDIGWFMRTDSSAVQRTLEYLYRRLWAGLHREARVDRYIERFMTKARLAHTLADPTPLTAMYKGYSFTQRTYKTLRAARKHINAYVKESIITGDFDTGDLLYTLRKMYAIRTSFVTSEALERYEELGFDEIISCDCGHLEVAGDTHDVRNVTWCDSCFDDDAVMVEDQGEYWPRDDAYYHESSDCYYSYEERRYDDDDDDDGGEPQDLMSYSTNVLRHIPSDTSIQSSKFGNFTMGVELEMCAGSRSSVDEAVSDVRARLGEDYCICKSDGSLPSDGFEIVTAPRGLDEHIRRFKAWDVRTTYRAWNAKQCGLHVHMDSRAFTQMTLGKFLMFINADCNADFIRSLAGRHPKIDDQARNYCAAEDQDVITDPLKAVKGKGANRYRMVNVTNMDQGELTRLGLNWRQYDTSGRKFNTVELRIFRASLKKERLLAQIEFAHAAVMFVRAASYRDLTEGSFKGWLAKSHVLYPHLAAWYEVVPKKKANPNVAAVVAADETVA
jgi:hypothetical protein